MLISYQTSIEYDREKITHFCQFYQRAFSSKLNRDRHKTVACPKRFNGEEGMTSFSNDSEDLERRTQLCAKNGVN